MSVELHLSIKVPSAVSWSPDGRSLAYQATGATGSDIHIYDVAGKSDRVAASGIAPFQLYKDLPDLRWQADGQRLTFKAGLDYQIVSLAGDAAHTIAFIAPNDPGSDSNAIYVSSIP